MGRQAVSIWRGCTWEHLESAAKGGTRPFGDTSLRPHRRRCSKIRRASCANEVLTKYATTYQDRALMLAQSNIAPRRAGSRVLAGLTWVSPNASLDRLDLNALERWTGPMAEKPVMPFDSLQYPDWYAREKHWHPWVPHNQDKLWWHRLPHDNIFRPVDDEVGAKQELLTMVKILSLIYRHIRPEGPRPDNAYLINDLNLSLPHPQDHACRFMLSASGYIRWLKAHRQNDIDECLKEHLTSQDVERMLAWRLDQPGGVGVILDLTRDQREMNIGLYLQHDIPIYYPWTLSAAADTTVARSEGLGCNCLKTTSLDTSGVGLSGLDTQTHLRQGAPIFRLNVSPKPEDFATDSMDVCIRERWKFDYAPPAGQFYDMAAHRLKIAEPATLMPVPSLVHPLWGLMIPPPSHKDTGCQGTVQSETDDPAAADSEQCMRDVVVQVDFGSHNGLDPQIQNFVLRLPDRFHVPHDGGLWSA
ncbi:hypothetical protein EV702DRAFT_1048920 [Suillus placidus]|uniref:Uncharacterized protein n=1 Tax=Suillus placidus TaxID=48579 RepID=A0A9P7CXU4_9AGAM|nr:hypothetical protein EV702DRAFT_1048920 [Suillus placidus]